MSRSDSPQPGIFASGRRYWSDIASREGSLAATRNLLVELWQFLRDSTPSRKRQRFGDADYDWDFRVNTTSGAVGWRERLLGVFHSAYQPTEPGVFHEMLAALRDTANANPADFSFIDLGSGKGRTLLMASDYPFHRVLGIELLPALNRIARENIAKYKSDSQKCFALESICADASSFAFPEEPLVIYLFNPLMEAPLRQVLSSLAASYKANPRTIYVLYHNPQLEWLFAESNEMQKVLGTDQYSIFRFIA
jgi:SAM-dependent methyltransferase